jgi:hypothetical protein
MVILAGCENSQPVSPSSDPEFFVTLSGYDSIEYKSPGVVNVIFNDKYEQLVLSTILNVNNKKYTCGIYLFFLDKKEKIGEFPFTNSSKTYSTDFAVGTIEITEGNDKDVFFSTEGKLKITKFDSSKIVGSFYFTAYDSTGKKSIVAKNGIIDFTY